MGSCLLCCNSSINQLLLCSFCYIVPIIQKEVQCWKCVNHDIIMWISACICIVWSECRDIKTYGPTGAQKQVLLALRWLIQQVHASLIIYMLLWLHGNIRPGLFVRHRLRGSQDNIDFHLAWGALMQLSIVKGKASLHRAPSDPPETSILISFTVLILTSFL